jgi:biotin synthase
MKFNNSNQIIDFGVDRGEIDRIIESGKPFETSGCPHCNRPFANERPSQPIRNFPFKPTANDIEDIKRQIWLYEPFLPLILK